jgi:hypothetical protein
VWFKCRSYASFTLWLLRELLLYHRHSLPDLNEWHHPSLFSKKDVYLAAPLSLSLSHGVTDHLSDRIFLPKPLLIGPSHPSLSTSRSFTLRLSYLPLLELKSSLYPVTPTEVPHPRPTSYNGSTPLSQSYHQCLSLASRKVTTTASFHLSHLLHSSINRCCPSPIL